MFSVLYLGLFTSNTMKRNRNFMALCEAETFLLKRVTRKLRVISLFRGHSVFLTPASRTEGCITYSTLQCKSLINKLLQGLTAC
jgi:hypothetical protein